MHSDLDWDYCMSSFLMYRMVISENKSFTKEKPARVSLDFNRESISNSIELLNFLKEYMNNITDNGESALALSGGMDSILLASMMPTGSTAYTFRCIVPEKKVDDESEMASKIAKKFGLKHKIVNITWEDVKKNADILMMHKNAPIHSIETQIYKAALQCKDDGFDNLIFGENADIIYGGMDGLLKRDWTFGDFIERYSYVMPHRVLRKPEIIVEPFLEFESNGYVDAFAFTNKYFRMEALGTYTNACSCAGINFIGPYSQTKLGTDIDLNRIRSGDSKYIVREAYKKKLDTSDVPIKKPMPRATNEWLSFWNGPKRKEFIKHSTNDMSGDQKWMVYCLERYLNIISQ